MNPHACITAITPTQRDPSRYTIAVDDKVVGILPDRRIRELGLQVGMMWSEALHAQVKEASDQDKVYRLALTKLNRKMFSRFELQQKLQKGGYADPVIQDVLNRLAALGLIDDVAFGKALIRMITLRKPAGVKLLASRLRQKGLSEGLVAKLLEEHVQEHAQFPEACKLARKVWSRLSQYPPAKARQKLWGTLARRGFPSEIIQLVIEQLPEISSDDWLNHLA